MLTIHRSLPTPDQPSAAIEIVAQAGIDPCQLNLSSLPAIYCYESRAAPEWASFHLVSIAAETRVDHRPAAWTKKVVGFLRSAGSSSVLTEISKIELGGKGKSRRAQRLALLAQAIDSYRSSRMGWLLTFAGDRLGHIVIAIAAGFDIFLLQAITVVAGLISPRS